LQFILDGSMEYGAKIDKLLENLDIKEEEDEQ
jgi:ribosome-binding factor A